MEHDPTMNDPTMDHQRRGPWSQAEDTLLMNLVTQNGASNWVKVSSMLQTRSAKQCRERYHQNLKPTLNHEPISAEEGELIEHLVATLGKRWAEIARRLHNRSDNAVKNWWNGSQNRRRRHDQRSSKRRSSYDSNESYRYSPYRTHMQPTEPYSPLHRQHQPQPPRPPIEQLHRPMYYHDSNHAAAAAAALPSPTDSWTGGNGQYPGSRPFSRWSQDDSQSPVGEADMSEAGSSYAGSPTSHTSDAHLPPLCVPRESRLYPAQPSPSGYFAREESAHWQQLPPIRDALDRGSHLLTAPSSPGTMPLSSQQVPRTYSYQTGPRSPSSSRDRGDWAMCDTNTRMHPNPDPAPTTLSAHDSKMKMKLGNLLS
ncbi:hypothetical protein PFICI_08362 [Pestalotiopsis fici W106-1]|uniref:Myb-like DNA-binding protein myb-1 n=1 Tax=Pestalotiopsis fici (strain W106-1 / CGMCC3.15140) TaxID=1229662 RepID=W3X3X4_PESFW|nr:uncharacterized protein PFICI_08362 [Pestalotiopsis fici W106-1]ETS80833.1 hypothetical protein PFICI_08362 [Pestalotiopsis fici W106-1]